MKRTVQDVMTKTVVVIGDSAPFKEILRQMHEYRVSALPVVDGEGRIAGIVSEADLLLKEEYPPPGGDGFLFDSPRRRRERVKAAGLVASQLMTSPAITIGPDATVVSAARLMHGKGVKRLPVVDEERRVIGIVSRTDLLQVFLRPDEEIGQEVSKDVIQRAFWLDRDAIRVLVKNGVVTLEGQVEQRSLIPLLMSRVMDVDGVVGVENRLSYEVDDTHIPLEMLGPWGVLTQSRV